MYLCRAQSPACNILVDCKSSAMLEKLAKQTAVYGISTIVVRFLSYLLTPYYTRIFGQETYGVVTDIYALIPLALTLLTMGMESS